jgi:hypothetical protein
MHRWQHVLLFLIESKEFWAAIAGALIGGLMTGWFTLRAQKQAAKDQRMRDRETEREAINGTLEAIATEVEVFKVKFLDSFERVFTEPDSGTPFRHLPKVASLRQNLCSVFDSNAAVLGKNIGVGTGKSAETQSETIHAGNKITSFLNTPPHGRSRDHGHGPRNGRKERACPIHRQNHSQ